MAIIIQLKLKTEEKAIITIIFFWLICETAPIRDDIKTIKKIYFFN
jgi:hypothetical protein